MLRRIVSRLFLRPAVRCNHALRNPVEEFRNCQFVTNQPNPFHTEKRVVSGGDGMTDITVITRPAIHGDHCTIGIMIPSGSRNGIDMPSGITHLDEKLAFGITTDSFSSRAQVRQFLDGNGGICDSQTDQETTIFALSIRRDAIDEAVMLLTETAFRPNITVESVAEAIQNVENDIRYLKYEKIRDKEIMELACQAGFRANTIGLPRMMPDELIQKCNNPDEIKNWADHLLRHRRDNYLNQPPAFIGIGVKTDELEAAVNKYKHLIHNPCWSELENTAKSDKSLSQWTGGFRHQDEEAVNSFSIGDQASESYFCIGWEAPSYHSSDKYAAHVLRSLLGGGSSFESGGPGKGLKCILYQNVLATINGQYFSHFKSFYKEFTDSGIFGIYGMGPKDKIKLGLNISLEVLRTIEKGEITTEQVERAKTQLTNQFLRDMEVRAMMMESFARETMAYGEPVNPNVTCERINQIEKGDLVKLSRKLLNTVPSVSILGESDETKSLYDESMLRLSGTAFRSVRLNHALRTPVEGFDQLKFVTEQPNPFHTEQSKVTLNTEQYGTKSIKLITRPALHGIYCTIGLVLGAGSRYAGDLPAGICHLDEKLAFGPTDSFKTRTELGTFLDRCGGICDAQTDQESTIYALSIDRSELENGVLLLVESAFRPQISTDNVSEAFVNVENEVKYLQYERIRDKEVVELTIEAGYQMQNIGVPRSMSESTFGGFNADDWTDSVRQYRHANYLRSDPSIVGVGVTMDELERAVRKITHLIEKPSWESKNKINLNVEPAKWSGGFLHRDSSSQSFSIGGVENESYFSIGWKAASYTNGETETRHDRYVCHVLRALLGGGSAFESGGPGKGLKSFLYANVLGSSQGQHFSHFKAHYKEFTDSGIFTIYGQAHPKYLKLGVHIAQGVMRSIAKGSLTNAEVERAKTQLMNQYLRDMEVRAEMMEGFARETLAFEDPVNPEITCNHIRQVRKNDIVKMANQLLSNNPAIAILGESNETSKLYDDACKAQLNSRPLLGAGSVLISSAKGSLRGLLRL